MPPDPRPPEGVCLLLPDGRRVPLECVYVGQDVDGVYRWRAVLTVRPITPTVRLGIAMLPPRTLVELVLALPHPPSEQ